MKNDQTNLFIIFHSMIFSKYLIIIILDGVLALLFPDLEERGGLVRHALDCRVTVAVYSPSPFRTFDLNLRPPWTLQTLHRSLNTFTNRLPLLLMIINGFHSQNALLQWEFTLMRRVLCRYEVRRNYE